MFGIGTTQFLQKTYSTIKTDGIWKDFLGDLMHGFVAIVYGKSGEGKTEFCVRMAKYLSQFGDLAWLSYEQKHGADLQRAIKRNQLDQHNGRIVWYDPLKRLPAPAPGEKRNEQFIKVLKTFISRKNRPKFMVFDSLDYMRINYSQYLELKELAEQKGVSLIFLSHAKGDEPKTAAGQEIEFDGHLGILVKHYIARMKKNRLGGRGEYVIWEEEARRRDPLFFAMREGEEVPRKNGKSKKPRKAKKEVGND